MRRYALVLLMIVAAVGMTWAADTGKPGTKTPPAKVNPNSGEIQGTVTGIDAARSDQGWVFTVSVRTVEGNSVTVYARPKNGQAYSTAGELKAGEKVKINWSMEPGSTKKWVTSIQVTKEPPKPTTTKPPTKPTK